MCECKVGPGKSAETFMAWEQAMLGNSDLITGSEGYWLRSPLNLDADQSVVKAALDYGYCQECVESAGQDVRGGIVVWEDSQGFVNSRTFATRKAFGEALAEAEAADQEAAESQEQEG